MSKKTKFEQDRDNKAFEVMDEYHEMEKEGRNLIEPVFSGFCNGADWGAAYEKDRLRRLMGSVFDFIHNPSYAEFFDMLDRLEKDENTGGSNGD